MSKLIKRKDGSYSKRGLWDNIRANKGSGKKPTKDMLKQESKIKKEENMKSMYRAGGKTSKKKVMKEARKEGESFMEESKEIGFGAPGVKPPKRRFDLGGLMDKDKPKAEQPTAPQPTLGSQLPAGVKALPVPPPEPKLTPRINLNREERGPGSVLSKKKGGMVETGMDVVARGNRAEGKATMAGKKMMGGKYDNGGPAGTTKSRTVETNPTGTYKTITKTKSVNTPEEQSNSVKTKTRRTIKGALKDAGEDFKYNLDSVLDELEERKEARKDKKSVVEGAGKGAASTMKKGGAMSKFKTMAAAGKKKMGGKKC